MEPRQQMPMAKPLETKLLWMLSMRVTAHVVNFFKRRSRVDRVDPNERSYIFYSLHFSQFPYCKPLPVSFQPKWLLIELHSGDPIGAGFGCSMTRTQDWTLPTRADLYNREMEARAADYAHSCYGNPEIGNPTNCEFFYFQNITYPPPAYSYQCPFASKEVCVRFTQSVTFDTGLVDASLLGVNSPVTHKFRRKTTCSPLSIASPFFTNITSNGSTTCFYRYGGTLKYSSQSFGNITYSTTGHPFSWQVVGYKVR